MSNQSGRPKKATTRREVGVYLTDKEREAIDAIRGDTDRSEWIRQAIFDKYTRETQQK